MNKIIQNGNRRTTFDGIRGGRSLFEFPPVSCFALPRLLNVLYPIDMPHNQRNSTADHIDYEGQDYVEIDDDDEEYDPDSETYFPEILLPGSDASVDEFKSVCILPSSSLN